MSIKLNGVKPKGTKHVFQLFSGNNPVEAIYKVLSVQDEPEFLPDGFEPFVYLRLAQKVGHPVDNFIALPLSSFVAASKPLTDADRFWEDGKSVAA